MGMLSPFIKRQRLAMVAPYVQGDVLELGCGPGIALQLWADRITSYTGVDYRPDLITQLQRKYPAHTFYTRNLDDDQLDLGRQFDTILMIALVEHIYNQKHLMQQAAALLRPTGSIIITTPTPWGNDIVHRIGARLGLFSQGAADDHVTIYNRHRFEIMSKDIGLQIQKYRRFQLGCNQLVVLQPPA